jgi:hypothetical protein
MSGSFPAVPPRDANEGGQGGLGGLKSGSGAGRFYSLALRGIESAGVNPIFRHAGDGSRKLTKHTTKRRDRSGPAFPSSFGISSLLSESSHSNEAEKSGTKEKQGAGFGNRS